MLSQVDQGVSLSENRIPRARALSGCAVHFELDSFRFDTTIEWDGAVLQTYVQAHGAEFAERFDSGQEARQHHRSTPLTDQHTVFQPFIRQKRGFRRKVEARSMVPTGLQHNPKTREKRRWAWLVVRPMVQHAVKFGS